MRLPGASRSRVLATAVGLALVGGTGTVTAVAAALHAPQPPPAGRASAAVGVAAPIDIPVAPIPVDAPVAAPSPVAQARTAPVPVPVAPLRALQVPDLVVTLKRSITPAQLGALHAVSGLRGLSVLDSGQVHVGALTVSAIGVDPSSLRAFTPRETASSDGLWAAVARGDVAATYSLARRAHLGLGKTTTIRGRGPVPARLGAFAVFGVPNADVVLSRGTASTLGLTPSSTVVLAAPDRGLSGLQRDVRAAVPGAELTVLRPAEVVASKPRTYRELYMSSARYCPGLSWTVLAAIGQVESDHGRNAGRSSAGALGPMQFLPSTWVTSGVDGDGDGKADIMDPFDAVPSAALYLCRDGAGRGGQSLYDAIFSYNHADWYVKLVLDLATKYH